jgi:hypothetical protein
MSSAVMLMPRGIWTSCVSMKLRTALPIASLSPCSCVPPSFVGMPFTNVKSFSSALSVHASATSTRGRSFLAKWNGRSIVRRASALPDLGVEEVFDAALVDELDVLARLLVRERDARALRSGTR